METDGWKFYAVKKLLPTRKRHIGRIQPMEQSEPLDLERSARRFLRRAREGVGAVRRHRLSRSPPRLSSYSRGVLYKNAPSVCSGPRIDISPNSVTLLASFFSFRLLFTRRFLFVSSLVSCLPFRSQHGTEAWICPPSLSFYGTCSCWIDWFNRSCHCLLLLCLESGVDERTKRWASRRQA